MAPSIKLNPRRVRAALLICKTSVPELARKHRVSQNTLYAVLNGTRPGRAPEVQKAVAEMDRIVREVACA